MLSEGRLQQLIENKDEYIEESEGWAICDGALVIYDHENPPMWFRFPRDDDGNSIPPRRDSLAILSGSKSSLSPAPKPPSTE